MKTLPKIAILVGIYLYAQNKNKAGNLEMTASGNTPAVESGFLANLFTDNWVTYAGAIMSGASWKINDYDLYANAISNAEQANGIPTNLLARQLFQESRFRADVINGTKRSSAGAIGIAQFMPSTWAHYHAPYKPKSALLQITFGLRYITKRYTTPCEAVKHERKQGWY